MTPLGAIVWTINSACWFVLGVVLDLGAAYAISLGSAVLSYVWIRLGRIGL